MRKTPLFRAVLSLAAALLSRVLLQPRTVAFLAAALFLNWFVTLAS